MVVSILAATAFVATGAFQGISQQANDGLVRTEMQEIARAIRQFRQDTGYYPKTGPFARVAEGGMVPNSVDSAWFYSPANFSQLFIEPTDGSTPIMAWDINVGRGWRGPYLKGFSEGFVDIRADINSADSPAGNVSGDPLSGGDIPDVPGIADPFEHRAESVSSGTLLDWVMTAGGTDPLKTWGRPYLLFDLDSSPTLISMGPNGEYNQGGGDDIVLNIQ